MSKITDFATKEKADIDATSATLDGIIAGIAALAKMITDFQNSPGTLSASDQAALDGIENASKQLLAKAQNVNTSAPVSANFSPTTATVAVGGTANLTLTLSGTATVTVNLSSSDPSKATVPDTVSGSGTVSVPVTGVSTGTVTITATAPNTSATATVTVA